MKKLVFVVLCLLIVSTAGWFVSADVSQDKVVLSIEGADRFLAQAREDPSNWNLRMGVISEENGKRELAKAFFERAAESDDAVVSAKGIYNLAVLLYRDGQTKAAETSLLETVTKDPTSSLGWYSLGVVRFHQTDYAGSVSPFEKHTQLNPTDAGGFFDLGVALSMDFRTSNTPTRDQLVLSRAALVQALALDPSFPHAANNLAIVEEILASVQNS